MEQIKVEVGQYKAVNKGALKGFFTLVIYPTGQKIIDCKHMEKDGQTWVAFPSKEYTKKDGTKDWFPLISYLNKEYQQALQQAIIQQLPKDSNASSQKAKASQTTFQDDAPDLWASDEF